MKEEPNRVTAGGEAAPGGGNSVCKGMNARDNLQGWHSVMVAGSRWEQKWLKVRLAWNR